MKKTKDPRLQVYSFGSLLLFEVAFAASHCLSQGDAGAVGHCEEIAKPLQVGGLFGFRGSSLGIMMTDELAFSRPRKSVVSVPTWTMERCCASLRIPIGQQKREVLGPTFRILGRLETSSW